MLASMFHGDGVVPAGPVILCEGWRGARRASYPSLRDGVVPAGPAVSSGTSSGYWSDWNVECHDARRYTV